MYRVRLGSREDSKRHRVFVIVSRQAFVDVRSQTVICAPVYSTVLGLSTEVEVGVSEGLKHPSAIHCDRLLSLEKSRLTAFVGRLSAQKLGALRSALLAALALD